MTRFVILGLVGVFGCTGGSANDPGAGGTGGAGGGFVGAGGAGGSGEVTPYVIGEHAPGHTSLAEGLAAAHHLNLAHGLAGARIRDLAPEARLAIVLNFTPTEPADDSPETIEAARRQDDWENRWYSDPLDGLGYPDETADLLRWDRAEVHDGDLDLISAPIDLLGVNYYTRSIVSAIVRMA